MSSNKLAATVRRTILPISLLAACSDLPTANQPEVKQQAVPVDTVANNYKPSIIKQLSYSQPTILGGEDRDAKGIEYICTERSPAGVRTLARSLANASTVADTFALAQKETEQLFTYDCKAIAQRDTVFESDSIVVPAKPVIVPPVAAQSILNPGAAGYNGKTLEQNFEDLVGFITKPERNMVEVRALNGKPHFIVPWYRTSGSTSEADLHDYNIGTATRDKFVMVTDELREAALLVAMSKDCSYLPALRNTIETTTASTGLPGWVFEVSRDSIRTIDAGSASDGTAGLGLALYVAAKNPACSAEDRAASKALADKLLGAHMEKEYIRANLTGFSGQPITHVLTGGSGTTLAGLGNAEMWTGYYEVVVPFLHAGYASTGDPAVRDRARSVVEQFLITSGYDPSSPARASVGRKQFKLQSANGALTAGVMSAQVWDDSDAPRALWMGNSLRTAALVGEDVSQGVYKHLDNWVSALIATGSQTASSSCIQYTNVNALQSTNCGGGQYQNGIGGGLVLHRNKDWVKPKLDEAVKNVDWSRSTYYTTDWGVYRNRLPKFLGVAIGRDMGAYQR